MGCQTGDLGLLCELCQFMPHTVGTALSFLHELVLFYLTKTKTESMYSISEMIITV